MTGSVGELQTADEVVAACSASALLADCTLRRAAPHWLELEISGLSSKARAGQVVVVLVWPAVWTQPEALAPHLRRARSGNYELVLVGTDPELSAGADAADPDADASPLTVPVSIKRLVFALRARAEAAAIRQTSAAMELALERARYENDMLISVGRGLSRERDIAQLLASILRRAREVAGADAGAVFIVENLDGEVNERTLRASALQNDSRTMEASAFTLRVSSSSIVGTCVISSDVINIPDLYKLDPPGVGNNPWGFVHDRSLDDRYRYQTRSMLTVPMISARDQVIGVIQLINKRAKGYTVLDQPADFDVGVVPFDEPSINYAHALASQAGIALENALLYGEVKTLFDGFVRASVTAIESRDPTTSGHSERVATLTVGLAREVDRIDTGRFRSLQFSRDALTTIEYAALLHDFGKVGVREHVLVKAKKLYEHQRELIEQRFEFIRRTIELEGMGRKLAYALEASRDKLSEKLAAVDGDLASRLGELDGMLAFILKSNEPTVLEQGGFDRIAEIAHRTYAAVDGRSRPFLSPEEAQALQILRGSLTEEEREQINSHVVHTFNFLNEIPWGRTFREVPAIAGAHHEKLDGTGYPTGLAGDAIPAPARMMTIADIFDALTAKDRPYKKAVPLEKALDIIAAEVKRGMLDTELFDIFVGSKVYSLV